MSTGETTLSNHPFTLMLGGHPQAISLAAPMLEHQTLTELFQQLLESNIMDALGYQDKQSYASLRLSLEISINNVKKNNPEALDFFKLIGLLPGGIKQQELNELWGSTSWKPLKDHLIRASLLVYKPGENMLTLLPFMNTRAYELLEEEETKKTEFHLKCCKFYKDYWVKFLEKMNNGTFDLNEFVEQESNIWACIYRGINRKKDNNEYDEEEENSRLMMLNSLNDTAINSFYEQQHVRQKSASVRHLFDFQYPNSTAPEGSNHVGIDNVIHEDDKEDDEYPQDAQPEAKIELKKAASVNRASEDNTIDRSTKGSISNMSKYTFLSKKNSSSSYCKLKTEVSDMGTDRLLTKSLSTYVAENNQFKVEEMLVIYYISIVIRLCKLSDGLKAINEYNKKKDLSKRAQAHLYKLQGVLTLLSEKKEYNEAKKHFNDALKYFYRIGSAKGRAICRLGLIRVQ